MSEAGFAADAEAVALVLVGELGERTTIVTGADAHHLGRVRRLRGGERVVAADGRGRWQVTTVGEVDETRIVLHPVDDARVEPMLLPRLAVAFAVTKGDQPERVVAALTELGVDRIVPLMTARVVVRWDRARAERAVARYRRVAREATQQSRRARLPVVEDLAAVADLAAHPAIVLADRAGTPGPVPAPEGGEWLVVVGPEGGLGATEVDALAPGHRMRAGPHVLRAVTAPVAVAASLAAQRRPAG